MTPAQFVQVLITRLKQDQLTIWVGDTKLLYGLNRLLPRAAYRLVNPKTNDQLLQP